MKCSHWRPLSRILKHVFLFLFDLQTRTYLQNSSITLKYRSKYGTSRTRNTDQTDGSTSTNNKMAVDSLIMRLSVHVNLSLFLNLEIHSLLEDKTVNIVQRRWGHCEGKFNPPGLYIREHSRIHVVDHVKLVYYIKEQIESQAVDMLTCFFYQAIHSFFEDTTVNTE